MTDTPATIPLSDAVGDLAAVLGDEDLYADRRPGVRWTLLLERVRRLHVTAASLEEAHDTATDRLAVALGDGSYYHEVPPAARLALLLDHVKRIAGDHRMSAGRHAGEPALDELDRQLAGGLIRLMRRFGLFDHPAPPPAEAARPHVEIRELDATSEGLLVDLVIVDPDRPCPDYDDGPCDWHSHPFHATGSVASALAHLRRHG